MVKSQQMIRIKTVIIASKMILIRNHLNKIKQTIKKHLNQTIQNQVHLISNQIRQSQHNQINQIVNQQVTIKQIKNLHRKIINQCQIRL